MIYLIILLIGLLILDHEIRNAPTRPPDEDL